jgi:hypothetical protein
MSPEHRQDDGRPTDPRLLLRYAHPGPLPSSFYRPMLLIFLYADPDKKRYFKIESGGTGRGAIWTSDSVKRRKIATEEAAAALEQAKNRIVRAKVLNTPMAGCFLAREHGVPRQDFQAACFATGLVDKGVMPLAGARWGGHGFNINALCITAEDRRTGLGVGFACELGPPC